MRKQDKNKKEMKKMKKSLEYLMLAGTTVAVSTAVAVDGITLYASNIHLSDPEKARMITDYMHLPNDGLFVMGVCQVATGLATYMCLKYYGMRKKNEQIKN